MDKTYIIIRRHLYEEPDHTELEFIISNGLYEGKITIYVHIEDIKKIGLSLKEFPKKIGDEYKFEYGSITPAENWAYYFLLRTYTTDSSGHCAIQFIMSLNIPEPHEYMSKFSIICEPAAINRLGELLEEFSNLQHMELKWTPTDGELYK